MAINVDTVYKTVLLILNSEQRGYMTPDEFNRIGSQVQRQIFEAYFEDLNQQLRVPQSDMDYADRVAITDEKIAEFKTENNPTGTNPFTVPTDLYRLGSITYEPNTSTYKEIQRVGRAEIYNIRKAPLTAPTTDFPIYLYEDNKALVYPQTIVDPAHIKMQYVKKPTDIRWGYNLGALGQYVFTFDVVVSGATVTSITVTSQGSGYVVGDQITFQGSDFGGTAGTTVVLTLTSTDLFSGSTQGFTNFELHNSERAEVILKILLYAGVVIRDPQIIQVAAQKVQQEEVNEKS
jgi:hypothetical protein